MRTAGIVGGLGPESTIDYYRSILELCRSRATAAPPILINSLDVDRGIAFLDAGDLDGLTSYLAAAIEQLASAGADFAFLAANTPHLVFHRLEALSPIPLVSIVQATANRALSLGFRRLGLFGTGFTMRAAFYSDTFHQAGLELVIPGESERDLIHQRYLGELLKNRFLPETRDAFLRIAQRMQREDGIGALVLAGTEIPLLLREAPPEGLPLLDTTLIHVDAVVDEILRG